MLLFHLDSIKLTDVNSIEHHLCLLDFLRDSPSTDFCWIQFNVAQKILGSKQARLQFSLDRQVDWPKIKIKNA